MDAMARYRQIIRNLIETYARYKARIHPSKPTRRA